MNSLDDLRSTLEQHSHDTPGLDPVARRSQVGERIAATRRRRTAVRGGVALAAVVAVASAVLLPMSGDDVEVKPADRTVLDQEAPASLTAPDHTYRFVRGFDDAEASTLEVDVEFSTRTRVLSWATAGDDQGVRVKGPYDARWDSTRGDFEDWVEIPAGFEGAVTVAANNPGAEGLGAALYEADVSALPDVVDAFHGQYFRAEGPLTRRLAVGVGERGETELTFPYRDAGRRVAIEVSCDGLPAGLWVHASVGGAQSSSESDQCQGDSRGKGGSTILTKDLGLVAGGYSTSSDGSAWPDGDARVWVSRSLKSDTPVSSSAYPDARLAAAVYVPNEEPADVAGVDVPTTTWQAGHLWRLTGSVTDTVGPHDVSSQTRGRPALLSVITQAGRRDAEVAVTTLADGKVVDRSNFGLASGGAASGWPVVPLATREVEVRVRQLEGDGDPGVRQHLAVYELLE